MRKRVCVRGQAHRAQRAARERTCDFLFCPLVLVLVLLDLLSDSLAARVSGMVY